MKVEVRGSETEETYSNRRHGDQGRGIKHRKWRLMWLDEKVINL